MESDQDPDHDSNDESGTEEGDQANESGHVSECQPSFFTQLNLSDEYQSGPLQAHAWGNNDLRKGIKFKKKQGLQYAVKNFSIENSNEYIMVELTTNKWSISNVLRNTCKWCVHACLRKKHWQFEITQYNRPHTCIYAQLKPGHKQLDNEFVCSQIMCLVKVDLSIKMLSSLQMSTRIWGQSVVYKGPVSEAESDCEYCSKSASFLFMFVHKGVYTGQIPIW